MMIWHSCIVSEVGCAKAMEHNHRFAAAAAADTRPYWTQLSRTQQTMDPEYLAYIYIFSRAIYFIVSWTLCAFVCVEINCFSVALNFFCTFAFADIHYSIWIYTRAHTYRFLVHGSPDIVQVFLFVFNFGIVVQSLASQSLFISMCSRVIRLLRLWFISGCSIYIFFLFSLGLAAQSFRLTFSLFVIRIAIQATRGNATFSNNIKDRTQKPLYGWACKCNAKCQTYPANERKQRWFGNYVRHIGSGPTAVAFAYWGTDKRISKSVNTELQFFVIMNI